MLIRPTKPFERDLKGLSHEDRAAVISALTEFMQNRRAKKLNFEQVRSRRDYYTIRATYKVRILLQQCEADVFDIVAVGNHDYVYKSHARK